MKLTVPQYRLLSRLFDSTTHIVPHRKTAGKLIALGLAVKDPQGKLHITQKGRERL